MTTSTLVPLYGLVLAGGASQRMGHDKAALRYHGRTQLDWVFERLGQHCERVFVSMRADQSGEATRSKYPAIYDQHADIGPIAGIAAAQAAHPAHAWLVVACDLPFLTDLSLQTLVDHRDGRPVVAYRSAHDGLPEPLCAIYEPATRGGILAAIAADRRCPRKFVINSGVALLEQPDPAALDNINTPDEFERAREILTGASAR